MNSYSIVLCIGAALATVNVLLQYGPDHIPELGPDKIFDYMKVRQSDEYNYTADDGSLSLERDELGKFLMIASTHFSNTRNNVMDNPKFHMYSKYFPITGDELRLRFRGSAHLISVEAHPFGEQIKDPNMDPRLASGVFNGHTNNRDLLDFLVYNGGVSALIQPSLIMEPADRMLAGYIVPLYKIKPNEIREVDLELRFDIKNQLIHWMVNGAVRFTWQPEMPIPSDYKVVQWGSDSATLSFPTSVRLGVGSMSALEYYPSFDGNKNSERTALVNVSACQAYLNPQNPSESARFARPNEDKYRVWGQGAILKVRELAVESYTG